MLGSSELTDVGKLVLHNRHRWSNKHTTVQSPHRCKIIRPVEMASVHVQLGQALLPAYRHQIMCECFKPAV